MVMRGVAVTVAFETIVLDPMVLGNETHVEAPGAKVPGIVVLGIVMAGSVTDKLPKVVFPVFVTW